MLTLLQFVVVVSYGTVRYRVRIVDSHDDRYTESRRVAGRDAQAGKRVVRLVVVVEKPFCCFARRQLCSETTLLQSLMSLLFIALSFVVIGCCR